MNARVRTPNPSSNVLVRFSLNLLYFIKHYAASIRFILGSVGRVRDPSKRVELLSACWPVWEWRRSAVFFVSEMHQWQTPHIDSMKVNILLHGTRTHKHNTILSLMSMIAKNLLFGILVSDTSKHQNGWNSARRIIKSAEHFHAATNKLNFTACWNRLWIIQWGGPRKKLPAIPFKYKYILN